MAIDKNFYNEASASKLGWNPSMFIEGHTTFDNRLQGYIKQFQRDHDLKADGMCGPVTYRRLIASLESSKEHIRSNFSGNTSQIWYNDKPFPINWDNVATFKDDGFPFPVSKGYSRWTKNTPRPIKNFVNHWDVCLNSMSCAKVLARRNISVHFCIDNDGQIIQLHDLNDMCWHAGNSRVNRQSIGVEISNAYYLKYQSWYKRNGFGERPIVSGAKVHGRSMKDFTDFYPIQYEALRALWEAVHEACNIPYAFPENKGGYDSKCGRGQFSGFMNHFNCSSKKIDCANLDIEFHLEKLKS